VRRGAGRVRAGHLFRHGAERPAHRHDFVGGKSFVVTATDNAGNSRTVIHDYQVTYAFSGFFSPVMNPPTLNKFKGGTAVPVKFSLHGNNGLSIFAAGSPQSQPIDCSTLSPTGSAQPTAGKLSYNAKTDRYTYSWATSKTWVGTCRLLVVTLGDGTSHSANFTFTK
jgi:hypothetical protein